MMMEEYVKNENFKLHFSIRSHDVMQSHEQFYFELKYRVCSRKDSLPQEFPTGVLRNFEIELYF
jgi:hypothetical protein